MNPQHWQRIEQIYHAALECAPAERASFLSDACAGDGELRREVEALLAANDRASNFLSAGALEIEARETAAEQRHLPVGEQISHYRILTQIGAGGMGEVYLARDSRLDRQVALKVLPVQFTRDADRLHRFVREAKAASSLNHPNIITIHEIGEATTEAGLTHFIAAEYIEGVTLRQRMAREPLALREALDVAIQMAAALEAAHRAGIIHRDIKPENVMGTTSTSGRSAASAKRRSRSANGRMAARSGRRMANGSPSSRTGEIRSASGRCPGLAARPR